MSPRLVAAHTSLNPSRRGDLTLLAMRLGPCSIQLPACVALDSCGCLGRLVGRVARFHVSPPFLGLLQMVRNKGRARVRLALIHWKNDVSELPGSKLPAHSTCHGKEGVER